MKIYEQPLFLRLRRRLLNVSANGDFAYLSHVPLEAKLTWVSWNLMSSTLWVGFYLIYITIANLSRFKNYSKIIIIVLPGSQQLQRCWEVPDRSDTWVLATSHFLRIWQWGATLLPYRRNLRRVINWNCLTFGYQRLNKEDWKNLPIF